MLKQLTLPTMDLKSTPTSATITLSSDMEASSNISMNSETYDSSTLYGSAIGNSQTTFASFEDDVNHNDSLSSLIDSKTFSCLNLTPTTSSTIVLDKTATVILHSNKHDQHDQMKSVDINLPFIESEHMESLQYNVSHDEVDPKSQLANKTIFKTNNPNLSIIEINENSVKDQNIQNSVVVIESPSENENGYYNDLKQQQKQQHLHECVEHEINVCKKLPNSNPLYKLWPLRNRKLDVERKPKKTDLLCNATPILSTIDYTIEDKMNECVTQSLEEEDASLLAPRLSGGERPLITYDTLEEFEANLPSTVTVLDTPFGSRVYLVGTAHFSEESQNDVSFVIRNVRPDIVMIELCPARIPILKLDEKTLLEEAKNINFAKVRNIMNSHGYINGLFFILLLQMSAQMAKDVGMAPGGEFRRALEEVNKLPGCKLHLGDRPIHITLQRALRALSFWQIIKLVWHLTANKSINIEEIEQCKQRDLLEKLMQELAGEFPAFSEVFVRERDLYLCHSLQLASLPQISVGHDGASSSRPVKVVGIVGIGHANGISKMWGQVDPQNIPTILEIPPTPISVLVCKYTIKYSLIALTLYGALRLFKPHIMRL